VRGNALLLAAVLLVGGGFVALVALAWAAS
jgi:hypothetical protein